MSHFASLVKRMRAPCSSSEINHAAKKSAAGNDNGTRKIKKT